MPVYCPRFMPLLAAVALLPCAMPAASGVRSALAAPSPTTSTGPGRVIVTYRDSRVSALSLRVQAQGTGPVQEARTLSQRHALDLRDGRTVAPRTQVLLSDTLTSEQLRQRLLADTDVASVVIDHRRQQHAVPNDPLYPNGLGAPYAAAGQWYLRPPDSQFVSAINAEQAWNTTSGSSGVVVAVLDTGVRPGHPDLVGKLLPGIDLLQNTTTSNDGDGWDGDPSDPGDWVTTQESQQTSTALSGCEVGNSTWHGTQSAALVGAVSNNGIGMASVGGHTMVLPVRVLGKCGGYDSDIIAGMRWAAGLTVSTLPVNPSPAKVINLSLGGPSDCSASLYPSVISELASHGVAVVASAGNEHTTVGSPANCSGVIAVGGLSHDGLKADYSDFGSGITVSAPSGSCSNNRTGACLLPVYPIVTATNTGTTTPGTDAYLTEASDGGFGTSYSAPLVSGTVALMLAANPSLTPAALTTLLRSTARAFPASSATACDQLTSTTTAVACRCTTTTCGSGMLDAAAAVQAAAAGRAVAHIGTASEQGSGGVAITLDASRSSPSSGGTVQSWQWQVSDPNLATLSVASGPVTVLTPSPSASGTVTVTLLVTDSQQNTATTTERFVIGTTPSVVTAGVGSAGTTPSSSSGNAASGGGGGGGALDPASVLLGALALAALRRPRRARP